MQFARLNLGAVADVIDGGDQRHDDQKADNIDDTDHV
jgi:hypothetical protein